MAQWIECLTTDQKVGGSSPSVDVCFDGFAVLLIKRDTKDSIRVIYLKGTEENSEKVE